MAFSLSYTSSQIIGSRSIIKFVDTSTGSDSNITQRRILLTDFENNPVVPTGITTPYIEWVLADTTILVDVLPYDMALNIVIQWLDINGNVLYESGVALQGFTLYNETFYFSLTQMQAMANNVPPNIISDSNYYTNKSILRVEIDSGNNAITLGNDIVTAQGCYNRATYLSSNQNLFF
jgi:hypothetical protein